MIPSVLEAPKLVLRQVLQPGDCVLDATAGNGYDTLFLAQHVGDEGQVWGCDVQVEALDATTRRLEAASLAHRVTLRHEGHEALATWLPDELHGSMAAVMFNLGYLPGSGNKSVTTHPETTCMALDAAWDVLKPGGWITLVLYTGHPGGEEEADAVESWAAAIDQEAGQVLRYAFLNQRNTPPYAVLIHKLDLTA